MANSATLVLRYVTDASQASKGVESVSSKVGKFAKGAVKAGAAVAAALAGAALWKGFQRLNAIDQAQAKLKGLGYNSKQVAGIMDNVNASVKGTAFGLDEAATAAAGALASGIKPGKDLTRYLTLTGDAATQAGIDFNSMAQMMNKVQGQGKLTGDVVNQMAENGLYVIPMLAKEFKKPQAAIRKMVSEGKISAKEFQRVLQKNVGGSAQQAGKTVEGATKNVMAAMGRLGASVLSGAFSQLPKVLGGVTAAIDKLGPVAEKAGKLVGTAFSQVVGYVVKAFAAIGPAISKFASSGLFKYLLSSMKSFGSSVVSAFKTAAPAVATVVKALAPLVGGAVAGAIAGLAAAFRVLGGVIKVVANVFAALVKAAQNPVFQILGITLAAAFAPALAQIALFNAQMLIAVARVTAMNAVQKAAAIATKAWAAVQWALNVAMNANPIGLLIIAITAAIAIIGVLWNKNEGFRNFVIGAWHAIAGAATAAWNAIKAAISTVIGWAKGFISGFAGVAKGVWRGISGVAKATWQGTKSVVGGVLGWMKGALHGAGGVAKSVWRGAGNVAKATWRGTKAVINAVLGWAMKYLRQFLGLNKTVFRTIKSIAMAAWRGIRAVVNATISGIKAALRGLASAASAVWRTIKTVATTVWNAIASVVRSTIGRIKTILNSIKSVASRVWNGVKSAATGAFRAILKPVNAVKSAVQAVIDAVQSLINWLGKIKVPKISIPNPLKSINPFSAPAPASSPAAAPMATRAAFTSPTLTRAASSRRLGSTGGGSGNIVINVSGTLNDVDSANAIRRVMRNDQRRRSGITIDRTRQGLVN